MKRRSNLKMFAAYLCDDSSSADDPEYQMCVEAYDRSLVLAQKLVRAYPDNTSLENDLNTLLNARAWNAWKVEDFPSADAFYTQWTNRLRYTGDEVDDLRALSQGLVEFAAMQVKNNDFNGALASLDEAYNSMLAVVAAQSGSVRDQIELANRRAHLALHLGLEGDLQRAERLSSESLAALRDIIALNDGAEGAAEAFERSLKSAIAVSFGASDTEAVAKLEEELLSLAQSSPTKSVN